MEPAQRIVIVEDSAIQREVLRRLLIKAGYQVAAARDGAEGLQMARQHHPHLVVSDIAMPNMDGYQMCRAIKTDPELRAIPVVLLTELSDPKEIINGLAAGADNYITKPYDDQGLLEGLASLLAEQAEHPGHEAGEGLSVSYDGRQHAVLSSSRQILNLLLSTYENAVQRNRELVRTQLELKRLNESLEEKVRERTEELRRANEAKTAFVSNMSHELRTPMNAIIGMTELVLHLGVEGDQRECLKVAHRSALALLDMINALLDFTHLESGVLRAQSEPFDLDQQLQRVLLPLGEEAAAKGLAFSCRLAAATPQAVVGDQDRLREILVQLVRNAIKFTEMGQVSVTVEPVGAVPGGVRLRLTVADTGIGIAPELREKVFAAFAQGDDSNTRRYGGTGVGLSLASRLAELLGGRLSYDSVLGRGSRFFLELPVGVTTAGNMPERQLLQLGASAGSGPADPATLSGPALQTEAKQQLARINTALTQGRLEWVEQPIAWLKKAAEVKQAPALRDDLLRLALAARRGEFDKARELLQRLVVGF